MSEKQTEHEKRMAAALEEMEAEQPQDPSAATPQYAADLGTSASARSKVPTSSPKIVYHDRPYEQIRNAHNHIESSDVEHLLEIVYGESVYEAAAKNFSSFDPQKLKEVLSLSAEEVDDLLDGEDE